MRAAAFNPLFPVGCKAAHDPAPLLGEAPRPCIIKTEAFDVMDPLDPDLIVKTTVDIEFEDGTSITALTDHIRQ